MTATVDGDISAPHEKSIWSISGVEGKAFVDFQNGVHRADFALAAQEGYGHVEHAQALHDLGHGDRPGQDSQTSMRSALLAEAQRHLARRGRHPPPSGRSTRPSPSAP